MKTTTGAQGARGVDHYATAAEKRAYDFQWDRDAFYYYDMAMGIPADEYRRMNIKYHFVQGHRPRMERTDWDLLDIKLNPQYNKKDWQKIPHESIINNMFNTIVGERQRQLFEPIARDIGLFSRGEKNRLHLMYLQNYLERTIIKPFKAEITQRYMMEMGVQNIAQLDHDEQQQMLSDVNQRLLDMTPDKINEYFSKEYYSPYSEEAQMLVDFETKSKDLKRHFEERFKHGYIANVEFSYIYERYGLPDIEVGNPMGLSWEGPDSLICLEDAMRIKYEVWRDPMDLINQWGHLLKVGDIEKLEAGTEYNKNYGNNFEYYKTPNSPQMDSQIVGWYSEHGAKAFPRGFDQNTVEGQEIVRRMKARFWRGGRSEQKIRDCHIVFRTPVVIKQIGREVNGRIEYSYREPEYVFNPDHGDVYEKTMRSTEIRGARMLGWASKSVFVELGPLKYQWADIDDPRSKKLPYPGVVYNKLMGNAPTRGPLDRGIPYQIKYDIQAARLEEEKGFNIGKVFLMFMSAMPSEMTPEEWLDTIKYNRTIIVDEAKLTTQTAQSMAAAGHAFKSIDLSNIVGIEDAMQQMEAIYRGMMRAMSVNPERDGSGSPYASIKNTQQNLVNSSNKTLDIYTTHNFGINKTLQMYMDFCHNVYSRNPVPLEWLANDMTMAELRLSDGFLKFGKVGIYYGNDPEDYQAMQSIKEDIMLFIQNDRYELIEPVARIKMAKTPAELLNAATALGRRIEEKAKLAQKAQQEQLAAGIQAQREEKQLEMDHEYRIKSEENQTELEKEAIRDGQWAEQWDINKNDKHDLVEQNQDTIRHEKEEKEKDRRLQKELQAAKLAADRELARLKLREAEAKKPDVNRKKK